MVNEKVMEQIGIQETIFIIHIERAIRVNLVARFFVLQYITRLISSFFPRASIH